MRSVMLARKGLLPDGFLLTRLAEDQNQPNRSRSRSQRARFITKTGSCNVAHKNIREQVERRVFGYDAMKASDMQDCLLLCGRMGASGAPLRFLSVKHPFTLNPE